MSRPCSGPNRCVPPTVAVTVEELARLASPWAVICASVRETLAVDETVTSLSRVDTLGLEPAVAVKVIDPPLTTVPLRVISASAVAWMPIVAVEPLSVEIAVRVMSPLVVVEVVSIVTPPALICVALIVRATPGSTRLPATVTVPCGELMVRLVSALVLTLTLSPPPVTLTVEPVAVTEVAPSWFTVTTPLLTEIGSSPA